MKLFAVNVMKPVMKLFAVNVMKPVMKLSAVNVMKPVLKPAMVSQEEKMNRKFGAETCAETCYGEPRGKSEPVFS